jgi:ribosomal protein L37AE/L43A
MRNTREHMKKIKIPVHERSVELENCPFCGSEAFIRIDHGCIYCCNLNECGAMMTIHSDDIMYNEDQFSNVIKTWNRRFNTERN